MDVPPAREPGDSIIDRYLPDASAEEREEARENLRRLARFLIGVHERRSGVQGDNAIRAKASATVESESPSPIA